MIRNFHDFHNHYIFFLIYLDKRIFSLSLNKIYRLTQALIYINIITTYPKKKKTKKQNNNIITVKK